jgi:acetyl-CoA synthetase
MIPELPVAMLACARIGAPHSVVFGGFSSEALRDRIIDAEARVLITADGGYRRGAVVPLKANADEALRECPTIEHVVTVRRTGGEHSFTEGRDHWYHDLVEGQSTECEPEPMDAEDPLYLLYTSGTTGKPKGIVHTTGGYLTQVAATHRMIFDIHEDDVYWCAADIGWVTGHSYIVYGRLANHTTGILYEGRPGLPERGSAVGRSPESTRRRSSTRRPPRSARSCAGGPSIRPSTTCRRCGCSAAWASRSTPEAWVWYWTYIGGDTARSSTTWWQTETGGDPDLAAAGHHLAEAGLGDAAAPRRRGRRRRRGREVGAVRAAAATSCSSGPGRRSRERSGAIPIATSRPTSRSTGPRSTSPATARSGTRRGTSGCSAGSTTS